MKKIFYVGLVGLGLFEVLNVYFIMPMPGSQRIESIALAYFLYSYRWAFRVAFGLLLLVGALRTFSVGRWWLQIPGVLVVLTIIYMFNFRMTADHMFLEPQSLEFAGIEGNSLSDSSIVIAVVEATEAKAYPIRYIQYHHQVRDYIAGKPIMVTYCNVCRTGRVFEPVVNGRMETFRLVGMDHFNAMFEDVSTKSWWRQANGEAIIGPLAGQVLPEVSSDQLTLGRFFALYPQGKVMMPEPLSMHRYDTVGRFEKGLSKSNLTRRDTIPWQDKSWVVGVVVGDAAKAFDWLHLGDVRVINDRIGGVPIVLAIHPDGQSFVVFERQEDELFEIRDDSLVSANTAYDFAGLGQQANARKLRCYQEFWHSWKQFHPDTEVYR